MTGSVAAATNTAAQRLGRRAVARRERARAGVGAHWSICTDDSNHGSISRAQAAS